MKFVYFLGKFNLHTLILFSVHLKYLSKYKLLPLL